MKNSYKDLKHLNHVLNLNYDIILDEEIIYNTLESLKELENNIHETYFTIKEEGYYIDDDAYNLMSRIYHDIQCLSRMLDNNYKTN